MALSIVTVAVGGGNARAQYVTVKNLDLTECENDELPFSDMSVVNSGETGVGKVVFDAPVRRVLRDNSGPVGAPLAVVALEASGTVPLTPVGDLVVLSEDALWLVANDNPTPNAIDIEDRPQISNTVLLETLANLQITNISDYTTSFVDMRRMHADADTDDEVLLTLGEDTALRLLEIDSSGTSPTVSSTTPYALPSGQTMANIIDVHAANVAGGFADEVLLLFGDGTVAVSTANGGAPATFAASASNFVPQAISNVNFDGIGGANEIAVAGVTGDEFMTVRVFGDTGSGWTQRQSR